MSGPKMPAGVALTLHGATTLGERKLTWEETRWLAAFAKMDDRGRRQYLYIVEEMAIKWPRNVPARLQLVRGGGK